MKRSQRCLLIGIALMVLASLIRLNQDLFVLIELSDGLSLSLIITLSALAVGSFSNFMLERRAERLNSGQRDEV